ncbi:MAG TPA: trypsin-like peptidase domain-containing protein [Gemmataceae bacterium]|nr:trypsin-like peptidase domain-containing protein [Gemmataceae bacterium]
MQRRSVANSSWVAPILVVYALLLVAGFVLIYHYWPAQVQTGSDPTAKPRPIAQATTVTSEEKNRIEVFSKAKASVVNISSNLLVRDRLTLNVQQVPQGTGTGFIWDEKGRVVTNYHVVKGADRVIVTLDDHTVAHAVQIRYDEAHDLAVLWTDIPAGKSQPIPLGDASKLQVGQSVLAIGNPFGLDHSLSSGIISALSRSVKSEDGPAVHGLIQTDAAINPGNSGGPLLDSSGRLIGVNCAIISPSGASAGIGFAIPVDVVNRIVPHLISGAKDLRPGLGIVEAPDQWAKRLGVKGVIIQDVLPDSPAAAAKLRPTRRDEDGNITWGDRIVGIDEHKIDNAKQLYSVLTDDYKIGQEVTVHIKRDDEDKDVKVTLSADSR